MPGNIEQKTTDPEAELSNVQRIFQNLAPLCSVEKRAGDIPQLASQEKQLSILASELKDTLLCINLAKKGMHALRDFTVKGGMKKSIFDFEKLNGQLRDESAQRSELDCLNYLAQKHLVELMKQVPTEADELEMIENANTRLRRMENKLDLATKRFCLVNTDNKKMRDEINILLVERNNFNIQWNRTIGKLVKGKEYLMDILEIASNAFNDRDECCKKLEALKWKGLFQMNRDIMEMQSCESELNHLAKLEEFLRVKGSRRVCEADEREEIRIQEEIQRCEQEIKRHDALLGEIFAYTGSERISAIINRTKAAEIENFSIFVLLCDVCQESILMQRELAKLRQTILDQRNRNEIKKEDEENRLAELSSTLEKKRQVTNSLRETNETAENLLLRVLRGIDDLFRQARCDANPLMSLLGNHKEVTKWNVKKFLPILETEIKSLIEIVYGAVKPPAPTPKGRRATAQPPAKLVADPQVEVLIPNKINSLVPYQPCAYCVEDYITHLVFETPAVPADDEYVQKIFHLEDVNTNFGIYTLTVPEPVFLVSTQDASRSQDTVQAL